MSVTLGNVTCLAVIFITLAGRIDFGRGSLFVAGIVKPGGQTQLVVSDVKPGITLGRMSERSSSVHK